jgi:radical SAM superfamily enzyme YgiQ (UPF0313 family)
MTKPLVALVGAEYEENLSLRYLSATLAGAGFATDIAAFNEDDARPEIVRHVLARDPLVVGVSVPFQVRARELLAVTDDLRRAGYRGHICVGGHFATFEYEKLLADYAGIDSIVRHEGEQTFLELCCAVRDGRPIAPFAGLVRRGAAPGTVEVGAKRPLPALDDLPWPDRPDLTHEVMGIPTAPLVGSRGCYADCSFCCIYAYAENARGPRYRQRSPESIVREMAEERARRGVRLFVFHDDNFFMPYLPKNLERYRRMKELLDAQGLGDMALVIKCRPNDVDRELFTLLRSMGMIRAYVGIETNSNEGVVSLNRRITSADNRRALELLRELDMYCSFNVLIFDPEASLEGIEANLDFMQEFADTPFNFCRAEVYAGTPLKEILEGQGRLSGDYFAWGYQMREPLVELLFRIASTAFAARNFKSDGVHNLNMGIRFDEEVVRCFYPEASDPGWHAELVALSRQIGEDSVTRMREALAFVRAVDPYDHAAVKAFTLDLARGVARADLAFVGRIKTRRRQMEARVRDVAGVLAAHGPEAVAPPWAAETGRLGSSVGLEVSTELLPQPSGL